MYNFVLMSLGSFLLLNITYFIAIKKNNFGIIDIVWGLGFIVISFLGISLKSFSLGKEIFLFIMILIWGLRLSLFLLKRNFNKPEDYRYKEMRDRWGKKANLTAYYKIFILQFFLMQLVALPIYAVHFQLEQSSTFLNKVGILFWFVGLLWETIADHQKSKFKSHPENQHKLCQVGLWKFSRHPNYFGESLCWWGFGLYSFTFESPWGLLGSLFINFLLLKVTGVPFIENKHAKNKDFEEYKKSTPRFIPSLTKILKRG